MVGINRDMPDTAPSPASVACRQRELRDESQGSSGRGGRRQLPARPTPCAPTRAAAPQAARQGLRQARARRPPCRGLRRTGRPGTARRAAGRGAPRIQGSGWDLSSPAGPRAGLALHPLGLLLAVAVLVDPLAARAHAGSADGFLFLVVFGHAFDGTPRYPGLSAVHGLWVMGGLPRPVTPPRGGRPPRPGRCYDCARRTAGGSSADLKRLGSPIPCLIVCVLCGRTEGATAPASSRRLDQQRCRTRPSPPPAWR